jgi:uncharacterized protein YndB with AHSA1/START domain
MAARKNRTAEDWTGREFVITREFAAPRELVFKAWTDPKHLAQWWGPNGFTNPVCEWDARPGGKIYDVMRAPDGVRYPVGGEFLEIIAPERLGFACGALDANDGLLFEFLPTVTFVEAKRKTKLTIQSRITMTTAGANKYIGGFETGMTMSLERLSEHLPAMASEKKAFFSTRTFDAPRELVWKVWTEREHVMEWFGPKGFAMTMAKMDFRPGGSFHYCVASPDGRKMWGKFVYREIISPEKIVSAFSFSDQDGGLIRHPFSSALWPLQMLNEVIFSERDGKTTVTVKMLPLDATDEERQTFDGAHGGMNQGWIGTFDQLAVHLAKMKMAQ